MKFLELLFVMVSTILCPNGPYSRFNCFTCYLMGTCLMVSSLYLDKQKLGLIFTVNLATLYLLTGINSLFFYFTFFGLAALVMCLLIIKNKDYYYLQNGELLPPF